MRNQREDRRWQEAHGLTDPQIAEQMGKAAGREEEHEEESRREKKRGKRRKTRGKGRGSYLGGKRAGHRAPGACRRDEAVSGHGSDRTSGEQRRTGRTSAACALFWWGGTVPAR